MTGSNPHRGVAGWLAFVYLSIFAMVVIGGITRLTGSGLSMVEWKPLMGALPPLDAAAWQAAFEKYQEFPQYQQVNHWMELEDFKRIFFWEYLHRLWGRSLGLIFALPFAYFGLRGRLQGIAGRCFVAFVLGGAQGVLGWYMVTSGLVDVPRVSHLRLASHLGLALVAGNYVLWQLLYVRSLGQPRSVGPAEQSAARGAWALVGLTFLQVTYGAFMAGKHAGQLFKTFPTMNGSWFPASALTGPDGVLASALHNPVAIHAIHRTLAWAVAGAIAAYVWRHRHTPVDGAQRGALGVLVWLVGIQIALGAATVMTSVSLPMAVAHQAGGALLLSATVYAAWAFTGTPRSSSA